ncbi:MAG: winged helix-turn-helix transcriptional regulator [Vampirovibrionales bacterium]
MSLHTPTPSAKSVKSGLEPSPIDATATQLENALRLVGDKYSLQIIYLLLKHEAQRFVELENAIQGISPRTLSARLKHLEFHGLITRKAYPTIPPKVEYRATEKGQALMTTITSLAEWSLIEVV